MASPSDPPAALLAAARRAEEEGEPARALADAWRALDRAPDSVEAKILVARLLRRNPALAAPGRRDDLARLLADPAVDPIFVAVAGWRLLLSPGQPLSPLADDPAALAGWAEADSLVLALLAQSFVALLDAELALTRLRRWLLLSDRAADFPRLVAALAAQAAHNGGAWWFDEEERARLDEVHGTPIAAAYRPERPSGGGAFYADPVTRAVADQYRAWPYPAWSRLTARPASTLPAAVEARDGGRPSGLPVDAELLVAGCGTGREAASLALTYPDARIVAIDLSEASLAYAAARCAEAGIAGIDFRLLDIHRVAALGKAFDFISCSGVLHHLADPEAGWAALTAALRPGGAMRIMVYSKVARLRIRAAQARIADLSDRPVDADLLRAVRKRLIDAAPDLLSYSPDFYTMGGVHDLLLHRHEDPFDVPRIVRGLDALGLELLSFELPTPRHRARYRAEHPDDPAFRDVAAWAGLEKKEPFLFAGMYRFWCRKPAA